MIFTSVSLISLLAVVPTAVQAVPVFSHSPGLLPRQAANLQTELSLDPSQVATGSQQDGQGADVADNQVRSKTSFNNFANFCLTQNVPLTNGQQIKTGSCNPTIMGVIASTSNMPRSRFEFPKNGQVIKADTPFTLRMKIANLQTGNFVNPNSNYYAAPQTVNGAGDIIGHSHVTIQKIVDVASPDPLDPSVFAFFKGFNGVANNGVLTADVPAPGLPSGFYRMCSINTAANHQPALVAVAQHGSLDDCVYFECAAQASDKLFFDDNKTAGAGGGNNNNNGGGNNNNNGNNGGDKTASSSPATPPATGNANNGQNGGNQANNGQNGGNQANNGQKGGEQANNGQQGGNQANNGQQGGNQANNGQKGGEQANNGQKGGQANNGGANNQGNDNKGQAAQQAADKAKQEADAKKAAEDQKKAEEAAKAAAGTNASQQAAQQAADKAKQAADAKKAAEDQKKAQQQSNANNKGGKKNRRSMRFQRN